MEWEIPEYELSEKGSDWFWAVGIVSVSIAVTSIIFNNVLFALVILLSALALTLHAVRKPPLMHVILSHRGVRINDLFYPYNTLDSFWVEDQFHPRKLIIKSRKFFMSLIVVPLPDDLESDDLRDYLDDFLPSEEHHEPFLQKVLEYFGF